MDGDFRAGLGQRFAGTQIKRHAFPSPVVDLDLHRDKGFDDAVGVDAFFLAIAFHVFAGVCVGGVLAADRAAGDLFGREWLNRAEHLDLFIADRVGVQADGRLHRGQGQELHEVILNHVAHDAGGFIIRPAAFDADGFGDGDLDVVDVVAIPDRFKEAIGEAEDEHVLDGLFAEVVIDAEDLGFIKDAADAGVEFARGGEVSAEGFFDNDAAPGIAGEGIDVAQAGFAEMLDDGGEFRGAGGEVIHAAAADVELFVEFLKALRQAFVARHLQRLTDGKRVWRRFFPRCPDRLVWCGRTSAPPRAFRRGTARRSWAAGQSPR